GWSPKCVGLSPPEFESPQSNHQFGLGWVSLQFPDQANRWGARLAQYTRHQFFSTHNLQGLHSHKSLDFAKLQTLQISKDGCPERQEVESRVLPNFLFGNGRRHTSRPLVEW